MNLVWGIIDWGLCSVELIAVSIREVNCKLDIKVTVMVGSNYYINTTITAVIMDMHWSNPIFYYYSIALTAGSSRITNNFVTTFTVSVLNFHSSSLVQAEASNLMAFESINFHID